MEPSLSEGRMDLFYKGMSVAGLVFPVKETEGFFCQSVDAELSVDMVCLVSSWSQGRVIDRCLHCRDFIVRTKSLSSTQKKAEVLRGSVLW